MIMTDIFRNLGRRDAIQLREEAASLNGTQIIDREHAVPYFDPDKDYSVHPAGTPVSDEGNVWTLIQPHNAANYDGRPSTLRALWSLVHTTNPSKAKPWVKPYGTSGMYMTGEVYKDSDGVVWRCNRDDVVFDAHTYPEAWEAV